METITDAAIVWHGQIFIGKRHAWIRDDLLQITTERPIPMTQGFLTDTGRFVDRAEAAKIALAAKQIPRLKWPPHLYSEDLWEVIDVETRLVRPL